MLDKSNVVHNFNKAVDQVSRDEIREKGRAYKELMDMTRYIWQMSPRNLNDKQQVRISEHEHLNLKINRASLPKRAFREYREYTRPGWSKHCFGKWFWWAIHSRLKLMRGFAWIMWCHQECLNNYIRMSVHNGTVEGINNKVKSISYKAYGFRAAKIYIRSLFRCMAKLYVRETMHTFA